MVNFVFMSHRFFIFFSILVIRDVSPESGICFCCHIYPFLVFFNTYITKNTFLGKIYTLLFCLLCPPKNYFGVFLSFIICNSFCFSLYFDWYRIFCPIISYKNLFDCDPFCVISGRFSCFNPPCDRNLVHFICIYHNP